MKRKFFIITVLIVTLIFQLGCSKKQGEEPSRDILKEFNLLLQSDQELKPIIKFINENIKLVSKEDGSLMVEKLEIIQKEKLSKLESKFFDNEKIESSMLEIYTPDFDIYKLDNITNEELKKFLVEVRENGYKIETAEAQFYPVINYEIYKGYTDHVIPAIKDYIEIMAIESNQVPAKDAALVISWDEVLTRALKQEEFIKKYPTSSKINEIKELYEKYINFAFYGLNNTLLFDYDTKKMNGDAKKTYLNLRETTKASPFTSAIIGLIDISQSYDYKLSKEIEEYRNDTVKVIIK